MSDESQKQLRDAIAALRQAHDLVSDAEGWFEDIQHAGYAVPRGQGRAFDDFWERLHNEERALAEALARLSAAGE